MTPLEALQDMFGLTERQAQVLAEIMAYRDKHGYSPTLREIASQMGFCLNRANLHVRNLVRKHALTQGETWQPRTLIPCVRFIRA